MSYVSPYNGKTRLDCVETAKLVRKALKKAFPATKFKVRSDRYAGGASICVYWTDGPTSKMVDGVIGVFEGAGFDGMIDLKYHKDHWLDTKTGEVTLAKREGTTGSVTEIIVDPPSATAILVSFGADYVRATREISDGLMAKLFAEVAAFAGVETPATERDAWNTSVNVSVHSGDLGGKLLARNDHSKECIGTLARMLASGRDYSMTVECPHVEGYGCGGGVKRCTACGEVL